MLDKPDIADATIIDVLDSVYGIACREITFLPLGADTNTAVYRAVGATQTEYFVKLRRGDFNEMTVVIPAFLHRQGVPHLIAPLSTRTHTLWAKMEAFKVMVYPFIEGKNGYEVPLSETQWHEMGRAFRHLHATPIPPEFAHHLPHETYSPHWRTTLTTFLSRTDSDTFTDPITVDLFAFLAEKRTELLQMITRTEQLAEQMQSRSLPLVLCHADIHAGNALVQEDVTFYIVDWDTIRMAPRERDLMYVGAGLWGNWQSADAEETFFYRGHGESDVDPVAIAYYRYERVIEDIALYCDQILQPDESDEERALALHYLKWNFVPDKTIAQARRADLLAIREPRGETPC
jgi:spectinomycin phosphotransferase